MYRVEDCPHYGYAKRDPATTPKPCERKSTMKKPAIHMIANIWPITVCSSCDIFWSSNEKGPPDVFHPGAKSPHARN